MNQKITSEKSLYEPQINIDSNPAENVIYPIESERKKRGYCNCCSKYLSVLESLKNPTFRYTLIQMDISRIKHIALHCHVKNICNSKK